MSWIQGESEGATKVKERGEESGQQREWKVWKERNEERGVEGERKGKCRGIEVARRDVCMQQERWQRRVRG